MTYGEALEWLRGERSMWNLFASFAPHEHEAHVWSAQADAAMTQQAYWMVRAHQENLLDQEASDD